MVAEIEALGGEALGVTVDVGERDQVERMVAATVERFGRLDILVNNAQGFGSKTQPEGSPGFIPLERFPEDVWDFTFQTGLKAYALRRCRPRSRTCEERGGKIINFGSGNGIGAMKGTAAYNATKEAIRSLSRTAAAEWGKHGICVNVIIPTMLTDSADAFFEARPGIREKLAEGIPLRASATSSTTSARSPCSSRASDSDFITGQAIHVDGGQILRP